MDSGQRQSRGLDARERRALASEQPRRGHAPERAAGRDHAQQWALRDFHPHGPVAAGAYPARAQRPTRRRCIDAAASGYGPSFRSAPSSIGQSRPMTDPFLDHIRATLDDIEAAGVFKHERLLTGPQGGRVRVAGTKGEREAINLCANNYLGLANHPEVVAAAKSAMDEFGFGMASVRFICGAQTLHRELEQAIAKHLGKDDAIVFAACFDANGGVFEP